MRGFMHKDSQLRRKDNLSGVKNTMFTEEEINERRV